MAVDPLTAIVGGTNAHPKAFPWQALIVSGRSKCGGVLISTSWVLTAAHCFRNVSRVHLGVTNYKSSKANWQSKDVAVYAKHKLYNGHSDSDDIGLMKLASPVKINDYVRPACLPKPGADFETSYPCFISGWGRTSPKAVKGHHVLQFTRVDVLPQNICVYMWKLSAKDVDMRNICTDKTRSSRGACFGDSGGPLTCEMDGRYYAAGVASFIYGHCDARFHPDVYTRVSQYEHWIFTTIHKYGFK
ncbi:unnamed protein product [Lymnaea stagnalis]|uniref:Peptidase S1 domain-containing protein n=1 Tax=Lymnaea stagnalis TaxID=6523 RepID=A0AAV2HGZ8_LYMST